jgi:hypothetical protein
MSEGLLHACVQSLLVLSKTFVQGAGARRGFMASPHDA